MSSVRILPPGLSVEIVPSEPYELGSAPINASVITSGEAPDAPGILSVLLRLRAPIVYRGVQWEYLVARPRRAAKDLLEVAMGATIDSSLTAVPGDRASSSEPLDLAWWRGGLGIIGTLSRT